MKKIFKRTLAMFLTVLLVFGAAPLAGIDLFIAKAEATTISRYSQGDIIEFGWYPQSLVTDYNIINSLNDMNGEWISYKYYMGTDSYYNGEMYSSDYMRYKDVIYGSNKYRGVTFDTFRPYSTVYTSSNTYQDDNGYNTGSIYWFKYEPIKWRILDPDAGIIMSELILDSQAYNNYLIFDGKDKYGEDAYFGDVAKTYYSNNYAKSSIREWLNNNFYTIAFSNSQQNIIEYTALDNSAYSNSYSEYDSETTNDKIYLLSWNDITNTNYGFSSSIGNDTERKAQGTSYAKCQGLSVTADGYSPWRLRTAGSFTDDTCRIGNNGAASFFCDSVITYCGVRPVLNLNPSSEIFQSNVTEIGKTATGGATTPSENIYNLGEETYGFGNFSDDDSSLGHCFGMSMTSSAYYIGELDVNQTGISNVQNINGLTLTDSVKEPICYYQPIQGSYSAEAIVAGGSFYLTSKYNIENDWNEVVNYVKNHNYDNKGSLQIGFRKNGEGGHAINFIRYEEVDGQPRIYAYDNNFPTVETYFYKDPNGKIQQAPYSTFSGAIDCIALRDVATYFSKVDDFDSALCIYADRNEISINGVEVYPLDGNTQKGERVVFEIPANVEQVTIIPLVNNAEFTYLNEEYSFGNISNDSIGIFKLATSNDGSAQPPVMTIVNKSDITGVVIKSPSTTTISYGDSIILHADLTQTLPSDWLIKWESSNGNFDMRVSEDGTTCKISPNSSGDATFTATVYDADGNAISSDEQTMTSKAGFFDKIIAFFKGLFGLTKTIPQ